MQYLYRLGKFWILILLVAFGIFFGLNNQDPVAIDLSPFFRITQVPVYVGYLGAFVFGATLATIFFGLEWLRMSMKIRTLRKQLTTHGDADLNTTDLSTDLVDTDEVSTSSLQQDVSEPARLDNR